MKKTNVKFAEALTILSLLSIAALYFEIAAMVVLTVSIILAVFIAFMVMMNVYHYDGYSFNMGEFWFTYSAVGGVIIIAIIYAVGMHLLSDHLGLSIITGLFPVIIPVIGLFIGDMGRILIKAESSAIGKKH